MAFTALQVSPLVGDVGALATFAPVGAAAGNERRWYLATAPGASALPNVATQADPETARLPVNAAGDGLLTPDVPGFYTVRLDEVVTTLALAHWQEPLSPPQAPAPVVVSSLTSATFWVAQTISRQLGSAPDTVTLAIRTYADQVDSPHAGAVALTKPSSAAIKLATARQPFLDLVADLQNESYLLETLGLQASTLAQISSVWNAHAGATTRTVHAAADPTGGPVVPASQSPYDLRDALEFLVLFFNGHSTYGPSHFAADPDLDNTIIDLTSTVWLPTSPPALTDLARLANRVDQSFRHHITVYGPHGAAGDGAYGEWNEPVRATALSIYNAIVRLGAQLTGHRAHTTQATHAASDGVNFPASSLVPTLSSPDALYGYLNTVADAINRHAQNQDASGNLLTGSSAYHTKAGQRLVTLRASSALTAALTAEQIVLVTEEHFLDTTLHASGDLGTHSSFALSAVFNPDVVSPTRYRQQVAWPYTLRFGKLLRASLAHLPPTLPDDSNSAASTALLSMGWT